MAPPHVTPMNWKLCSIMIYETPLLSSLAGALQMIFYHQSSEGAASGDQLGQITLPQFRAIMQAAKVINARFLAEKVLRLVTDT